MWRPGHDEVSYVRDDSSEGLWLYDVGTRQARRLGVPTSADPGTYQWSNDGSTILFQGANDLWVVDVQSGEPKRLTNNSEDEEEPTCAPAGHAVAFVRQ